MCPARMDADLFFAANSNNDSVIFQAAARRLSCVCLYPDVRSNLVRPLVHSVCAEAGVRLHEKGNPRHLKMEDGNSKMEGSIEEGEEGGRERKNASKMHGS